VTSRNFSNRHRRATGCGGRFGTRGDGIAELPRKNGYDQRIRC